MALHTGSTATTLVRSPAMGRTSTVCGMTLTTRVSSAETAGHVALIETTLPPYWDGAAPHAHAHTTEVIYVVSGTLACILDDTTTTASHGTSILIPPRAVHTVWNPAAAPATYLTWRSPGSVERYCEACAAYNAAGPVQTPAPQHRCAALSTE